MKNSESDVTKINLLKNAVAAIIASGVFLIILLRLYVAAFFTISGESKFNTGQFFIKLKTIVFYFLSSLELLKSSISVMAFK